MSASPSTPPAATPAEPEQARGAISASGWLGADGVYSHADDRKLGRALGTSLLIHGGLLAIVLAIFAVVPSEVLEQTIPLEFKMAFVPKAGPGGGGGGSPAPAPVKKMEIPTAKAPVPVPIAVPTPVEPPPMPTLVAPITTNSTVLQASGTNLISMANYGGGGRGGGVGTGTGNGVGPGTGGGFGGGAYAPGNGVSWPEMRREEKPKYTSDAMRAKIQGQVELEIIVLENGTVGDVRVTKSLDRTYGLDQAAMEAAKKWLFKPGVDRDGKPVATRVGLVLEFRLH
ncbi:MAG TPA: energy transducer TonB [Vicinamibacterales bacterium]|nr:energy transducer TonB [Vicinamibacterales bacterium]